MSGVDENALDEATERLFAFFTGATDPVGKVAVRLMAAWEVSEGEEVSPSYVATFADMARVVVADCDAHDRRVRAEALRAFAETRGVNVGDEDDEWWRGYRQAQRECLRDAIQSAQREGLDE